MDYAELYMTGGFDRRHAAHPQSKPHAHVQAATGAVAAPVGSSIHALVGGTLSAQAYTERLESLERRVGAFDEKLMNLTRLIKLTQGLQAEKDADLRKENEELRARLQRQEHLTAQLLREVAAVRETCEGKASAGAVDALAAELRADRGTVQGALDRLADEQAARAAGEQAWEGQLEDVKTWARRNMQRLKDHVDALNGGLDELREGSGTLSTRIDRIHCKAETEYKKLRILLQQKATEADAMAELIDKELRNVRDVAQRHVVLGTADADPTYAPPSLPHQ